MSGMAGARCFTMLVSTFRCNCGSAPISVYPAGSMQLQILKRGTAPRTSWQTDCERQTTSEHFGHSFRSCGWRGRSAWLPACLSGLTRGSRCARRKRCRAMPLTIHANSDLVRSGRLDEVCRSELAALKAHSHLNRSRDHPPCWRFRTHLIGPAPPPRPSCRISLQRD